MVWFHSILLRFNPCKGFGLFGTWILRLICMQQIPSFNPCKGFGLFGTRAIIEEVLSFLRFNPCKGFGLFGTWF